MKVISALALTALLSSTAAFAQTTATAPANASAATPTTSVNPATGNPTVGACKKQAKDKNLTGADRAQYIKDCKAGKTTN